MGGRSRRVLPLPHRGRLEFGHFRPRLYPDRDRFGGRHALVGHRPFGFRGVTVGAESPRQNTGQSKHGQTWEKVGRRGKRLKCRFRVTSGGEWLVARGKGRVSGVEGWVSIKDSIDRSARVLGVEEHPEP